MPNQNQGNLVSAKPMLCSVDVTYVSLNYESEYIYILVSTWSVDVAYVSLNSESEIWIYIFYSVFFKKNILSDFLFHPEFQMKDLHNQISKHQPNDEKYISK